MADDANTITDANAVANSTTIGDPVINPTGQTYTTFAMPPVSIPFTDGNNRVTSSWYLFLLNLYNRTGGSTNAGDQSTIQGQIAAATALATQAQTTADLALAAAGGEQSSNAIVIEDFLAVQAAMLGVNDPVVEETNITINNIQVEEAFDLTGLVFSMLGTINANLANGVIDPNRP